MHFLSSPARSRVVPVPNRALFGCALLLLGFCVGPLFAQQMAKPGWRGNFFTPEAWWRHSTLVRFPAGTTFKQAEAAMSAVIDAGADSMILPDLAPPDGAPQPFPESAGTDDDLDALLREASARRMHVLLQAPLARLAAHPGEVRYWMNRNIAGFDVGTVSADGAGALQALRATVDHHPGQRILLARWTDLPATTRGPLAFRIVSDAVAGSSPATPIFVELAAEGTNATSSAADPNASALRSFLPLLLATGQPILDSRLIGTEAGRAAMGQMLALRNSRPALRSGKATVLQSGDLKAWLFKSTATGQRSLVIVENTGTAPATLHLQDALHKAGARGTFLRPILRTDKGMGALGLETGTLPPGTFAITELQY